MKYSKSGAVLPTINPVIEYNRFGRNLAGRAIAGCEKVNGIDNKYKIYIPESITC